MTNYQEWLYRLHLPCRYIGEFSHYADGGVSYYLIWWQWGRFKWGARMQPAG